MRTTLPPGVLPPVNWTHFNDELLCCVFALVATLVVWLMFAVGTADHGHDKQCAVARVVQRTRFDQDVWI